MFKTARQSAYKKAELAAAADGDLNGKKTMMERNWALGGVKAVLYHSAHTKQERAKHQKAPSRKQACAIGLEWSNHYKC